MGVLLVQIRLYPGIGVLVWDLEVVRAAPMRR
jgi:hypothetical protein